MKPSKCTLASRCYHLEDLKKCFDYEVSLTLNFIENDTHFISPTRSKVLHSIRGLAFCDGVRTYGKAKLVKMISQNCT